MTRPVQVRALKGFRLWLRYDDGTEGEVDLSEFAGRGVFRPWDDYRTFEDVRLGDHGRISWGKDVDMCPDALYLRLTGRKPEEVFRNLSEMTLDA